MIPKEQTIHQNLSLRPSEVADETFLETVYAETRRGELAVLNWSREQENDFFKMQFHLQNQAYKMQFPDADYLVAVFRAQVTLTGQNGETRYALTNPFGYYRFTDIAAGETYVISVAHKRYRFDSQVLSINENLSEINFIASETLVKNKR